MKGIRAVTLAVLAGALALAGCGGGGEDDASAGAADGGGAAPITIGASLALTGDFAPDSKLVRDGYQMWADAVNAKGGIDVGGEKRKVELIIKDDGSDRDQAVRLVESLITQDEVDFLLSPWGSGNTSAVAPVADRYKSVMIAPLAASDDIWKEGYKQLFGILPRGSTVFWPHLEMAKEQGITKVAIVSTNDVFPLLGADGAKAKAKELGLEIVEEQTYPPEAVDVGGVISRVQQSGAEMVINTADANDAIIFVRQLKQRNYFPKLLVLAGAPVLPEFREALKDDAENVAGLTYWSRTLPFKDELFGTAEEFATAFEAKNGYVPTHDSVAAATAGYVLQRAIEAAGSTEPAAVAEALRAFGEDTVFGPVRFDESGSNEGNFSYVIQIQGGEAKIVFPTDAAEAELVYPHPDAK
jgi:branched-chain amino acid transport system substrate-binding protein